MSEAEKQADIDVPFIQVSIREYEQMLEQRSALQRYIRNDFDSSKDFIYQSGVIDKANRLNLPKEFIENLRNDLEVGS